jgi:transcription elongation factor GreA
MARITPSAHARLDAELQTLITTGRADVAQSLLDARGAGKMEENSDYWIAEEERGNLEARILLLEETLRDAEISDGSVVTDVVVEGCLVELHFGDDDADTFYVGDRLGMPDDDDVSLVTLGSPLGRALLGRSPGDVFSYMAPNGEPVTVGITALRTI